MTDVEWIIGASRPLSAPVMVGINGAIEGGAVVFNSKGVLLTPPVSVAFGSDQLTAGFVLGEGTRPCFRVLGVGDDDLNVLNVKVRGYLIQAIRRAASPPR